MLLQCWHQVASPPQGAAALGSSPAVAVQPGLDYFACPSRAKRVAHQQHCSQGWTTWVCPSTAD